MSDAPPSATLPAPGDPEVVYVLDVSGYVFRAYHALPTLNTKSGEPTHVVLGLSNMLLRLIEDQQPSRICVCYDPKGPSFRKRVYQEYKANRQAAPDDLKVQLARCEQVIDALQLKTYRHDELEADDLIATVVDRAREQGLRVVIVSSDKDLLQLVDDRVVLWDTMRHRVLGARETEEKLGVGPTQVRDYLALTGDSSDNIPGVPSVGPKTAQKLLAEHGSLAGIYAAIDAVQKPALKKKLLAHREDAELSRELVSLKTDAELVIDFSEMGWHGGDAQKLEPLFRDLEFGRLRDLVVQGKLGGGGSTGVLASSVLEHAGGEPPQTEIPELTPIHQADSEAKAQAVLSSFEAGQEVGVFVAALPAVRREGFNLENILGMALTANKRGTFVPVSVLRAWAAKDGPSPLEQLSRCVCFGLDLKRECLAFRALGADLSVGFDVEVASYLLAAGQKAKTQEQWAEATWGRSLVSEQDVFHTKSKAPRGQRTLELIEPEIDETQLRRFACERAALASHLVEGLRESLVSEGLKALYEDVELPLVPILASLERWGVRVDPERLKAMSASADQRLTDLEKKAHNLAGRPFNLASPKQLEVLFFDELGLPVVKKTSKGGRSTDVEVLEQLSEAHDLPAVILEHRHLFKLKGTYLDALPRAVRPATGRVHTVFHQNVAATGRLSSSDPNLQNIPIRTELGREIREAFVPEEGWLLLSADYSQIELRVLAHLSEDAELLEAFATDADVHRRTASALFGVAPEDASKEQRGQAKTVNYAVIYGQSPFALAKNLSIPRKEAVRYIEAFFERYAGVKRFLDEVVTEAKQTGQVRTLLGRVRKIGDLHSRRRNLQQAAERIARNTPIQGTAADIIKLAMVSVQQKLREKGLESRMLLSVHDELVFESPGSEHEVLEGMVRSSMEYATTLRVPLKVDTGWGKTWRDAH